ncbi:MAG: hypothetical protein R3C05_17405 [Pirellulaceae bacterium]
MPMYSESLDQQPVDQNLRKLWEALHEEEAKRLKFPIEVEEAMSIPPDASVNAFRPSKRLTRAAGKKLPSAAPSPLFLRGEGRVRG